MQHIIERRNKQGYNGENFVKDLPELFKNGEKYTKKGHPGWYYVGKEHKEAAIRTDYNQKNRNWLTSAYYLDEAPSQASAGFRTYDQNHSDKQFFPLSDLQKSNNIITNSKQNLNLPTSNMQQNNIQPQKAYKGPQNNQQNPILESEEEWLKRLRRQRQRKGFF